MEQIGKARDTFKDMFFFNRNPMIIVDLDGKNCLLNKECKELLNRDSLDSLFTLFPDIKLCKNRPKQDCSDTENGEVFSVDLQLFKESNRWVISLNTRESGDWTAFTKHQKILHLIFLELLSVSEEKKLYKILVERATKLLKIDRLGILLYNCDTEMVHGSWGTDSRGNIVDQSYFSEKLDKNSNAQEALALHDYVVYEEDVPLADNGIEVGRGWNATTAFFAGHKPIGWITCDNILSKESLPNWKKELLGELSRMTGELVFHLRIENHLKEKIEKKTKELESTIAELKLTQESLIEAEKMASLGMLVAGVSHEINTPVGVALTISSHILEKTTELTGKTVKNSLTKNQLTDFLKDTEEASSLAVSSLKKAANLINNFKMLSINKDSDTPKEVNLSELLNSAILSFQYSHDLKNITIKNSIPKDITVISSPMDFYQIFTNLISNSLLHGFKNRDRGNIEVIGRYKEKKLQVTYRDNGVGIPKELHKRVFDPFFTTSRSEGGTGLGLNIIYNTVLKLGGSIKLGKKQHGTEFNILLEY